MQIMATQNPEPMNSEPSEAAQRAAEAINNAWRWDIPLDEVAAIIDREMRIVDALHEENASLKRTLANFRECRGVDASPDPELPMRVLEAYIEDEIVVSEPSTLGKAMNAWQAERNAILRAAIARLQAEVTHS
jgi:hypothetical protein